MQAKTQQLSQDTDIQNAYQIPQQTNEMDLFRSYTKFEKTIQHAKKLYHKS